MVGNFVVSIQYLHMGLWLSEAFYTNNNNIVSIYKTMKTHYWIGNKALTCILSANDLLFKVSRGYSLVESEI